MVFIIIYLALVLTGIVGLVRGRVDNKLLTSRGRSLVPFVVGVVGLFATTAPPWVLAQAPEIQLALPPKMDEVFSAAENTSVPLATTRSDVFAEQKSAYPKWERQVTAAHKQAETSLKSLPDMLTAFTRGDVDRFTMWTHLAVMAANLEQAALKLHDLTPPTSLNLSDRKALETALTELQSSIHAAKAGLFQMQMYSRNGNTHHVQQAQAHMDAAARHMDKGVMKLVQVKQQLGAA